MTFVGLSYFFWVLWCLTSPVRDPLFLVAFSWCFFKYLHFVLLFATLLWFFSNRKSGSFCSVALHKQPESAVLLQKSKQSWQKTKQVGDIWKNSGKMLQAIEKACKEVLTKTDFYYGSRPFEKRPLHCIMANVHFDLLIAVYFIQRKL